MELKKYQKDVIADLDSYLDKLTVCNSASKAYEEFWHTKGIGIGPDGVPAYQNILPGVPTLCFKVPTGGGKTFLACNAIRPVFDALPPRKAQAVVWLVPSETILTQTIKCLKDTSHPYRQKIDVLFSSRVEVYTKQELLNGQNFNPTAVREQLSIMVLSYDSFRGRSKDVLKAYQENSNLASFAASMPKSSQPIENADETALFQVINMLNPLVIVDESHHATSTLSREMLVNFNPCFVLELTATPRSESNIISYVDAAALKAEHMIKLPVIVYNRQRPDDVYIDAIDLRNSLEKLAHQEELNTGKYIRPIVLFQAQPRGKEESLTFEKIRNTLIALGVPAEQIAIKTADINELRNVDLLSRNCPIRYIVTVNALKEGWDCSFAYVLASLANKTSQIDVEQILGRILRLPNAKSNQQKPLNMSYVLTSSNNFQETIKAIIKGLNSAGFSEKDCRASADEQTTTAPTQLSLTSATPEQPTQIVQPEPPAAHDEDDVPEINVEAARQTLESRQHEENSQPSDKTKLMLDEAEQAGSVYDNALREKHENPSTGNLPDDLMSKVKTYPMKNEFKAEAEELLIPQFFKKIPETIFTQGREALLEKEMLEEGFTLKGKSYDIDFNQIEDEVRKIDIEQDSSTPKAFNLSSEELLYFKKSFSNLPEPQQRELCRDLLLKQLNKLDSIKTAELKDYVESIVGTMNRSHLEAFETSNASYAYKIKKKIMGLLEDHCQRTFSRWLDKEHIVCKPSHKLLPEIHPDRKTDVGGSLYTAEEEMNSLETEIVSSLTALENIQWWHRNSARNGYFYINGFIKHYPDIMVRTKRGKLILIETKGQHLANDDSRMKLALGKAWEKAAGSSQFRYYMVFKEDTHAIDGAVSKDTFMDIVKEL